MPAPHPSDITLEELARLLNVWLEHDLVATTGTALTHWTFQTAARSPRLPRPDLALPLLQRLGFATPTRRDTFRPSPRLLAQERSLAQSIDRFAPALARCVFEQLLTLPDYADPLFRVLSYARVHHHHLSVAWKDVPRKDQATRGWLWLQQLGLMTHDGSTVTFDAALLPYALEVPPAKRRVSQAELDERLELQRIRSALAEDHVVQLEQERLRAAGVGYLAKDVVRVSIDDVTAGYDILSFELTGSPRYIEVKSSAGPRQFFILTRNECEEARQKGRSYWLAWVGWAARLPEGPCEVAWFQDPVAVLEGNPSPWAVDEGDFLIRGRTPDSNFQSRP